MFQASQWGERAMYIPKINKTTHVKKVHEVRLVLIHGPDLPVELPERSTARFEFRAQIRKKIEVREVAIGGRITPSTSYTNENKMAQMIHGSKCMATAAFYKHSKKSTDLIYRNTPPHRKTWHVHLEV